MSTTDTSRTENQSVPVETDLLLWWEDYYLPAFEYVLPKMGDLEGKRILELGTGTGGTATLLAKMGANVVGIDLLPFRLNDARDRVKQHGVSDLVDFSLMDATRLAFPDNSFDFIISKSVLVFTNHTHVAKECYRVLKPDGMAIFMENMRNHPVVWLYRRLFLKYSRNLHYFTLSDIDAIGSEFDSIEHKQFHLFSLAALFWQKVIPIPVCYQWTHQCLKRIDRFLLRIFPFLKRYCWITAMVCHKKT